MMPANNADKVVNPCIHGSTCGGLDAVTWLFSLIVLGLSAPLVANVPYSLHRTAAIYNLSLVRGPRFQERPNKTPQMFDFIWNTPY